LGFGGNDVVQNSLFAGRQALFHYHALALIRPISNIYNVFVLIPVFSEQIAMAFVVLVKGNTRIRARQLGLRGYGLIGISLTVQREFG